MDTVHYPNLRKFMKRHKLNISDIAEVIKKSYPSTHQKITRKATKRGKVALFDIEEGKNIVDFVVKKEKEYLQERFEDNWQAEWEIRWGKITDWFKYIFFDDVVTNVTDTD